MPEMPQWLTWLVALVGILSFVVSLLPRKYPGRIVVLWNREIGLFDDLVMGIPDFSMMYEGKPVKEHGLHLAGH